MLACHRRVHALRRCVLTMRTDDAACSDESAEKPSIIFGSPLSRKRTCFLQPPHAPRSDDQPCVLDTNVVLDWLVFRRSVVHRARSPRSKRARCAGSPQRPLRAEFDAVLGARRRRRAATRSGCDRGAIWHRHALMRAAAAPRRHPRRAALQRPGRPDVHRPRAARRRRLAGQPRPGGAEAGRARHCAPACRSSRPHRWRDAPPRQ